MPNAPWALVLCWWSQELESNSKRALLWGECGRGLKRPCVHWPKHPTFRQLGRDAPRAHLRKGTKLVSAAAFTRVKLSSGNQAQPQCLFAQESSTFWILHYPLLAIGTKRVWASSCSLLPGALQVIARDGNQFQTYSTSGRRQMGPEKALCALAPPPQLSLAREGPS